MQCAGPPEPVAVPAPPVTRDASVETFMDNQEDRGEEDRGEEDRGEENKLVENRGE